jgi:uncharacterized membrane protein YGL010W
MNYLRLWKSLSDIICDSVRLKESFSLEMFRQFFIGTSIVDELSFSNYYHKHPTNRQLHQLSLVAQAVLLPILLASALDSPAAGLVFSALVFWPYSTLNLPAAFLYLTLTLTGTLLSSLLDASGKTTASVIIVVLVLLLLSQLAGHLVYEAKRPAFRLFEAIVSTPVLMGMFLVRSLGFHIEDLAAVERGTAKWATHGRN